LIARFKLHSEAKNWKSSPKSTNCLEIDELTLEVAIEEPLHWIRRNLHYPNGHATPHYTASEGMCSVLAVATRSDKRPNVLLVPDGAACAWMAPV
jgi:hypothetical protein